MKSDELLRVQTYLRKTFGAESLSVRARVPKKEDSAEVYIGDEFIAVLFKDEDGDYQFQMAILEMDLAPPSA